MKNKVTVCNAGDRDKAVLALKENIMPFLFHSIVAETGTSKTGTMIFLLFYVKILCIEYFSSQVSETFSKKQRKVI